MGCSVLKCHQQPTQMLTLESLGIGDSSITHQIGVCAEHHYRLTGGERCAWLDEDRVLLMAEDLDSGGHVVLAAEWKMRETFGRVELVLEVETPSGKPADPIRLLVPREQQRHWLRFLQALHEGSTSDSEGERFEHE